MALLFHDELLAAVEGILFAASEPLSLERIAQILEVNREDALELVEILTTQYQAQHRGIQVVELAGGYQMSTRPELAAYIERMYKPQFHSLSHAALEALAIIAYKQPVTRGEIEVIRGVQSDRAVATLVDKNLVKEVGRKEGPGRPVLFGTTDEFLKHFGLKDLTDLPTQEEIILSSSDDEPGTPV